MPTTLTWDTQADWDAAQSRSQVVTRAVGDRVSDEVWQGYDPNYGVINNATFYAPLDESGTTVTDVIGNDTGDVFGASAGAPGILSSSAYSFDGTDDNINFGQVPAITSDSGECSFSAWIYPTSTSSGRGVIANLGYNTPGEWGIDLDGTGLRIYVQNSAGSYSATTLHTGGISTGTWYHVVAVFDEAVGEMRVYLNTSVVTTSMSGTRPSYTDDFRIGRRGGLAHRYFPGRIDEAMYIPFALSQSAVDELYNTSTSGDLTTARQTAEGFGESIETVATVPAGTSIDLTVHQEHLGTSTTHSQTISIDDGTNTYPLSGFSEETGNSEYWIDLALSTTSVESTARLDTANLTLGDVVDPQPIGSVPFSVGGTHVDVPIYDENEIETSSYPTGPRGVDIDTGVSGSFILEEIVDPDPTGFLATVDGQLYRLRTEHPAP